MHKNICRFIDPSGTKCKHPERPEKCQGRCEDFQDDLNDLYIEIDDRKKSEMSF